MWDLGEANLYVVLGPPALRRVDPLLGDLVEHPVLNLVTGSAFNAGEWVIHPWESWRDGGYARVL